MSRRTKVLLLGAGAGVVGWRVWSRRRTSAEEVAFDWNVPPAPEAGVPHTAGEAAESLEPPPQPAAADTVESDGEREAESRAEDATKFEQRGEREAEERREAAERLRSEPLREPDSDTDL